jgi:phage tail sheath protein FI
MVADPPSAYDPTGLHTVASAAADLCAARADMVAVLGLPRHARLAEARELANVLANRRSAVADVASYAGIWHPWTAVTLPDHAGIQAAVAAPPLRFVPPDGAVAGIIAATENSVGWWVEPAGRPLAGVVDVDALDAASTLELFNRGLNVIRRRPSGFAATSAHTVSIDRSLLQVSVRRLLIYVRKLAQREGDRFVFEPDHDRFRAQISATFTRFLEYLRIQGALTAYAVEVEALQTRSLADEGKVRIDLKLAPTSPIEFITISLLRSGSNPLQLVGAS